jgi:predicted GNAT family acetyltransferase
MNVEYRLDLAGVDWQEIKRLLHEDDFDNGRTPEQLKLSFENSHAACVAYSGDQIVGTARLLSDGVCNAYLLDVWTRTGYRLHGIARGMMDAICEPLRGQHVYLQADDDVVEVYKRMGYRMQPNGMSKVIGSWLDSAS